MCPPGMHVLTTAPRCAHPACTCSPRRPGVPIRRGMHVLTTAPVLPHRYRVEPAKKIGATVQVAEGPLATALVAEADALAFLARVDPALLNWELTKPPKPNGAVPGASEVLTRTRLRRRLASLGKAWPYVPESAAEAAAAAAAAGAAPHGAARGSGAVNDDDDDGNSVRLVVNDQLQALLPLADLVDADKERQRLGKQKSTLEASIATVSKRLNSPGFKDKAKPEILKKAQVGLIATDCD